MTVAITEFTEADTCRGEIASFECGSELWATMAADWIKQRPPFFCAAASIQKFGTRVWLYYSDGQLLGFGSLGRNRYPLNVPLDKSEWRAYIPMCAVHSNFQRTQIAGQRASDTIMEHLLRVAGTYEERQVWLLVHPDNTPACRLYSRFGFTCYGMYHDLAVMVKVL